MLQAHPLTDLVVSGFANNEIRITRRSSPPRPKNWGDKTAHKRLEAESKRLNQIIELGHELRRYQGQTFIEVPLLPYRSHVGIIKPLELTKSPTGIDLGVYRRSDVSAFRDLLIAEDRAIRAGNPPPLDITSKSQEFALLGKNTPSLRDRIETRFREMALGFLDIKVREKSDKLSRYARHTILEAGSVIERHWGNHAVFTTCTIPGSTPAALETVANNSGWLINRLYQKVRDLSKRKGIEIGWFFAWELQKRGALHPHIAIATKPDQMTSRQLLTLGQDIESYWFDLLFELKEKTGVDVFERGCRQGGTWRHNPEKWQSKSELVTKSVAAYLSKYASKGAATKHQNDLDNLAVRGISAPIPSRWWGCSRNILGLIKTWRFKHTISVAWLADPELENMLYSTLQGGYLELAQSDNQVPHKGCITKYNEVIERALGYRFAVVRSNRTIINGETEVYWYKNEVFTEIHGQIKAISEITYKPISTPKSSSPKRVVGDSILSLIANDNGARRINAEIKITGVDPGSGLIVDLEQFCWYQEWQEMRDPWYREETFRMADAEVEWGAKIWAIYLDRLQNMTPENSYEYQFGNQGPIREIGEWEVIEALCASWEVEKGYREM